METVLAPMFGEQLHADAYAKEGAGLLLHRNIERMEHSGGRFESAFAVGERSDPGQDHEIGRSYRFGVGRDNHAAPLRQAIGRFFKGFMG